MPEKKSDHTGHRRIDRRGNPAGPATATTIQRMLFWELMRVFLLCLIGLSGVFTLLAVLQQLQFGLSISQVLKILPLLTTTLLPYIIPPSCLFASCVVYGRLSHDNEAVALKAAGVDLYSALRPAFALGLVAAAVTASLQFNFTPHAFRQSKEILINDPEEAICLALKNNRMIKFAMPKPSMCCSCGTWKTDDCWTWC